MGAFSIDYGQPIVSLMAVSLLFWGALLIYFRPNKKLDLDVASDIFSHYYQTLTAVVDSLECKGTPFYFSPNNIFGLTKSVIFVPKTFEYDIFSIDVTSYDGLYIEDSKLVKFIPVGQALSEKIEEKIDKKFSYIDLLELRAQIDQTLINDLEMVKNLDIIINGAEVIISITGSIFASMYSDVDGIIRQVGDPLVSALACAISRSTRKPLVIENIHYDKNIIEVQLHLVGDEHD